MYLVYIASPYTIGNQLDNVGIQIDCANELIKLGYAPYAPLLSHYINERYSHSWDVWIGLCLEILKRCDFVLRLPGESKGADIEVKYAINNNIKVVYSIDELII